MDDPGLGAVLTLFFAAVAAVAACLTVWQARAGSREARLAAVGEAVATIENRSGDEGDAVRTGRAALRIALSRTAEELPACRYLVDTPPLEERQAVVAAVLANYTPPDDMTISGGHLYEALVHVASAEVREALGRRWWEVVPPGRRADGFSARHSRAVEHLRDKEVAVLTGQDPRGRLTSAAEAALILQGRPPVE